MLTVTTPILFTAANLSAKRTAVSTSNNPSKKLAQKQSFIYKYKLCIASFSEEKGSLVSVE